MGAVALDSATSEANLNKMRARDMRRKNINTKVRTLLLQLVLLVVIFLVWEWVSGRYIPTLMISKPSEFFAKFWEWVIDGTLVSNALVTFRSAGLGLLSGGICGLALGVILGQSEPLARIFEPFITALYTMPRLALIPLFIMWVGIDWQLSVLTAAVLVFFIIFFNTFFGIREVRRSLIDGVLIMGGTQWDLLWQVRLPSAMIWVLAALKLAVPQAMVGVVTAEILAGNSGLGYLVSTNARTFQSSGTFAALVALLIAGFVIDRVMTKLTEKPMSWKNADI